MNGLMTMKYKPGDKVKLKLIEDYYLEAVRDIEKVNGIGAIKEIYENTYYLMEEIGWNWTDKQAEEYKEEIHSPVPIKSRFELMDFSE